MIKIIGGKYNSRVIEAPDEGTVPTKSRVREAISNALQNEALNGKALDLFAGSGALGIQALSFGAKEAVFVDASKKACQVISANLSKLKINGMRVINSDYLTALEKLRGEEFSLVYLDPPYAEKEYYLNSVKAILEYGLLSQNGAIMLEYEGDMPYSFPEFSRQKEYNYGRSKVVILRR